MKKDDLKNGRGEPHWTIFFKKLLNHHPTSHPSPLLLSTSSQKRLLLLLLKESRLAQINEKKRHSVNETNHQNPLISSETQK